MRNRENVPFIERLASLFREPLKYRRKICMEMLQPFVRNKRVLEYGCGSGLFAFELYDLGSPEHITGIDISHNTIQRAQESAEQKGLTDRFTFIEGDASDVAVPDADIAIGLGFLDYLSASEIKRLFENIKSEYILFSFAERVFSVFRFLHILYMKSQRCPKHYYYTKDEIAVNIGNGHGRIQFVNDKRLSFACIVHNLPIIP